MRTRHVLALAAALIVCAAFLAPLLPGVYLAFAAVCHQLPERCFQFLGRPLGLCARCLGIYAGGLAALLRPVRRPWPALALLGAANAADWFAGFTPNGPRFVLGFALAFLAASALWLLASRERALGH